MTRSATSPSPLEFFGRNSQIVNATLQNYDGLRPFNDTDVILFTTFIVLFMVFGLFANLLTIAVIATSKKLRTIFHLFILSLCVSDTLSALISWINLYRRTWGFDHFMLPDFFCVLYWAMDYWTSYSTALHILGFAILRFIGIRWPPKINSIKNNHVGALVWIISIWLVTLVCGAIPVGMMSGSRPKDRTSPTPESKWPYCTQLPEWVAAYTVYAQVAFPIFFYIPIVSTIALSSAIIVLILRSGDKVKNHLSDDNARKRRTKEKNMFIQLALIVTSFMIGYVPFTAREFLTTQQSNDTYDTWWIDWHFGTANYLCLRFSECLNPVFYNVGSRTLRNETKKFLTHKCRCLLPSNATNVTTSSNATWYSTTGDL